MRRLVLLLILLGLLGSTAAPAQDCAPRLGLTLPLPETEIALRIDPVDISTSRSLEEVGALRVSRGGEPGPFNMHTLGLYISAAEIGVSASFQISTDALGVRCVNLTEAEVTVALIQREIHIARQIAADSCAYTVVLEHEEQHADVSEWMVEDLTEELRRTLPTFVEANGHRKLRPGQESDAATREILLAIQDFAVDARERLEIISMERNALIDDPARVRSENRRCGDTIREILLNAP